jgi:multidrug efflux system membrane fusion protein
MTELTTTARSTPTTPVRRSSWLVRIIIWLAVLGIFGAGFYFVINHQVEVKASGRRGVSGAISVVPATAKKADMAEYLDALGTVTPLYTASIVPQVTGVVTDVKFVEGQVVKVGDPLIEIDPRTFEATLQQAQGVLQRDQNLLAQAKMDMDRYQAAWDRKAIAKQQLDDQ